VALQPQAQARPARFPQVDPAAAALLNRWLQPRPGMAIALAHYRSTTRIEAWAPGLGTLLDVVFQVGDAAGRMHVPSTLLEQMIGTEACTSVLRAGAEQRCLLLEFFLLDVLEPLERLLDLPLHFVPALDRDAELPVSLCLRQDSSDCSAGVGLELSLAAAERLLAALDEHCPPSGAAGFDLPVALSVQQGWQHLSRAELNSLQAGDVVMLDHFPDGVLLNIGRHLQACATRIPGGLRLDETPYPSARHGASPMEQSPDNPLAALPVTLVCEVGRLELTLQALGQLVPGSVLGLGGSPSRQVELHANGRHFGHGELVDLGAGLGVRLTSRVTDE